MSKRRRPVQRLLASLSPNGAFNSECREFLIHDERFRSEGVSALLHWALSSALARTKLGGGRSSSEVRHSGERLYRALPVQQVVQYSCSQVQRIFVLEEKKGGWGGHDSGLASRLGQVPSSDSHERSARPMTGKAKGARGANGRESLLYYSNNYDS